MENFEIEKLKKECNFTLSHSRNKKDKKRAQMIIALINSWESTRANADAHKAST